jgi:hypothetical protein
VHGNEIDASLHGAIFDNAGGNNTHTNNIFYSLGTASASSVGGAGKASSVNPSSDSTNGHWSAERPSPILMDFGTAGGPANKYPNGSTPLREIAGSVVKHNIFFWRR